MYLQLLYETTDTNMWNSLFRGRLMMHTLILGFLRPYVSISMNNNQIGYIHTTCKLSFRPHVPYNPIIKANDGNVGLISFRCKHFCFVMCFRTRFVLRLCRECPAPRSWSFTHRPSCRMPSSRNSSRTRRNDSTRNNRKGTSLYSLLCYPLIY